jgi:hypothetical protein
VPALPLLERWFIMGLTNFPNGISSFGIPQFGGGIPSTFGTPYFVDYRNGSDGNRGLDTTRSFKTYSKAVAAATTNANDIILIDGDSEVVETAMVTVSKNRLHTIGLNGVPGRYGAGGRISVGVTTAATDIATILNTGVRNTFEGLKVSNSNTVTEGLYSFADGGEYTRMSFCEIYKSSKLNVTGAAELLCNADSGQYYFCTFGSNVNAISGAILRPAVLMTRETIAGKVARDTSFYGCLFLRKCGNTGNRFIYGANANDIERMCLIENSVFWNDKLATQTPAQNVAFGATLTTGYVLLKDCASIGAATAMSTTTGVYIIGYTPDATGAAAGIATQTA